MSRGGGEHIPIFTATSDLEVAQEAQLPFAVSALRFLDEGQLLAGGKNGQLYRVRLQGKPGGVNPMPHV